MIKNKISWFALLLLVLSLLLIFLLIIINKNKNKTNTENFINTEHQVSSSKESIILNKYKDLKYTILQNNNIFCNKDLDCAYDVLSNCMPSTFLSLSKSENTGYIISVVGVDKNNFDFCNFEMVNGSDHSKILNCSVDYKKMDKNVFNDIFEFKKHLEYCK